MYTDDTSPRRHGSFQFYLEYIIGILAVSLPTGCRIKTFEEIYCFKDQNNVLSLEQHTQAYKTCLIFFINVLFLMAIKHIKN